MKNELITIGIFLCGILIFEIILHLPILINYINERGKKE